MTLDCVSPFCRPLRRASMRSALGRRRPTCYRTPPMRVRGPLFVMLLVAGCGSNDIDLSTGVDLQVDRVPTAATLQLSEEDFAPDDCAVIEGAVAEPGRRRLLRFDTVVVNRGTDDLVVGDPAAPAPPFAAEDFEFSPCHQHFHFLGFATYELRDAADRLAGFGHKQSFCMTDSRRYTGTRARRFDCHFQGITAGWGDRYAFDLDGQWVDVTGLPAGAYTLVVTVNPDGKIPERTGGAPNVVRVAVTIP